MRTIIQGIPMSHLALLLGVLVLLFALPALFQTKKFRAALDEFFGAGHALIRLAALFHFLVAFLILNTHWSINFNSDRTIMTVVGYLIGLRGVVWLWFPGWASQMAHRFLQKEAHVVAMGAVALLLAVGFGYLGLYAY